MKLTLIRTHRIIKAGEEGVEQLKKMTNWAKKNGQLVVELFDSKATHSTVMVVTGQPKMFDGLCLWFTPENIGDEAEIVKFIEGELTRLEKMMGGDLVTIEKSALRNLIEWIPNDGSGSATLINELIEKYALYS